MVPTCITQLKLQITKNKYNKTWTDWAQRAGFCTVGPMAWAQRLVDPCIMIKIPHLWQRSLPRKPFSFPRKMPNVPLRSVHLFFLKSMFGTMWGIHRCEDSLLPLEPGFPVENLYSWRFHINIGAYWCIYLRKFDLSINPQKWGFPNPIGGGQIWIPAQMGISIGQNPSGFTVAKRGFSMPVWKAEIFSLRIWLPNVT